MKHKRGGPVKAHGRRTHTSVRTPGTRPVGRETRVRKPAAPETPVETRDRAVPKPLGPWMAMKYMLQQLGEPKALMLDVGAHLGNVTNMLLKLHPNAQVVCFEPNPDDCAHLMERFPGASTPVGVVQLALGSRVGEQAFYICGQNTEMSSLLLRSGWKGRRYYRHEVRETIQVQVTTLDAWIADVALYEVPHIAILKMDVQGGEKGVLLGAKDALKAGIIDLIYSEVMFAPMYKGAWEFWEMCRYLDKYGYSLFDVYGMQRSWISRQLKYADALWVSSRVREQVINQFPEEWLAKSLPNRMCPER